MSRPVKVLIASASMAFVAMTAGCGTEHIRVAQSAGPRYQGAVLFSQRCSGCHTLSYAATHGSASNVRTREYTNGPNFDIRCERPVTRVLYAIENGGFSGAIMPQNVVVGQDAIKVAEFVATYAGRQAPFVPGTPQCDSKPVGAIPNAVAAGATGTTTTAKSASATAAASYTRTASTAKPTATGASSKKKK